MLAYDNRKEIAETEEAFFPKDNSNPKQIDESIKYDKNKIPLSPIHGRYVEDVRVAILKNAEIL